MERRDVDEGSRRAVVIGPSSSSVAPLALARGPEANDALEPSWRARLVLLGGRVDPMIYEATLEERRISHGGS